MMASPTFLSARDDISRQVSECRKQATMYLWQIWTKLFNSIICLTIRPESAAESNGH